VRPEGPIRVLVLDASLLQARVLAGELDRMGDMHAMGGTAEQGELREQLTTFHPEVIVIDLGLRSTNPQVLLGKLRVHYPVPVIVAAQNTADSRMQALRAVQYGALDVVQRPQSYRAPQLEPMVRDLAAKIRMAVSFARPTAGSVATPAKPQSLRAGGIAPGHFVIAIGASTGGTKAIEALLTHTPEDFPPIVIVQHMPTGFTASFAQRLNSICPVRVTEAVDGELLRPGTALIARGDTHLVVQRNGASWRVRYTNQELVNRHCPSVDVLFDSVAREVGGRAIGVILTGMGEDGAQGLLRMREAGALTIAQDRASCVVHGMPKVAVDLGAAMHTASPPEMPGLIRQQLLSKRRQPVRA
jgi:two-component system chemotaxis response regulator CheB